MKTMIVDDEPWMLTQCKMECGTIAGVDIVGAFGNPLLALEFARTNRVELAFLDIEMPEMDGLTLAGRLRELQPDMIVIFVSAYESYMADAFRSHGADYYIMKPYDHNDVESAIDRVRLLSGRLRKKVNVCTFGPFELFVDGSPVAFPDAETKELMALIIDCRGGVLTQTVACGALWPDRPLDNDAVREYRRLLRKLREVLAPLRLESILEQNAQGVFIHTDVMDCDLYQYLDGDMKTIRRFSGAYMTGYPWAAATQASLQRQSGLVRQYVGALPSTSLCACIRCRLDDALTMTYMNESFLAICGYSAKELAEERQNSLRALILPEDQPAAIDKMRRELRPGQHCEAEFRLQSKSGGALWVMNRCELCDGAEDEAECLILDISAIKAEQHELLQQAQRDVLTGLWNRASAQAQIEQYIRERGDNGAGALLLMDVDNFKAVNDTYGHPFADTVLTDVAAILTRAFRTGDIVSRLGGDEMLVFLKDIGSMEAVQQKVDQVIDTIRTRLSAKTHRGELSCSFGISVFPDDAGDYATLYQKADLALYCAKEQKGRAVLYSSVRMRMLEQDMAREVTKIDAADEAAYAPLTEDARLHSGVTADVFAAIRERMAEIGREYDISRVYIFETTQDEQVAVNTFEWCAEGIEPEIGNLQALPTELLAPYYGELFENGGLFYCYDVRRLSALLYDIVEPQGIKSMLQCSMEQDGKAFGMVGFDECRRRCYWSGQEIRVLSRFASAVGAALHAVRAREGGALADLQRTARGENA